MSTDKQKKEALFKSLVAAAWVEGQPADQVLELLLEWADLLALGRPSDERLVAQLRQPPAGALGLAALSEQLAVLATAEEQTALIVAVEGVLLADGKLSGEELGFLTDLWALTESRRTPRQLIRTLQRSWSGAATPRPPGRRLSLEPQALVQGLIVGELLERRGPGQQR